MLAPAVLGQVQVTVSSPSVSTLGAPASGYVDVYCGVPAGNVYNISGYDLNLQLPEGVTSVRFTAVERPSAPHAYIFGSLSATELRTLDSATQASALAYLDGAGSAAPLTDDTGLLRVWFTADAGIAGSFPVTLSYADLTDNGFPDPNFHSCHAQRRHNHRIGARAHGRSGGVRSRWLLANAEPSPLTAVGKTHPNIPTNIPATSLEQPHGDVSIGEAHSTSSQDPHIIRAGAAS
jgi:hypothetical protein